jgi:uncharacterized protein (DUF1778 family)
VPFHRREVAQAIKSGGLSVAGRVVKHGNSSEDAEWQANHIQRREGGWRGFGPSPLGGRKPVTHPGHRMRHDAWDGGVLVMLEVCSVRRGGRGGAATRPTDKVSVALYCNMHYSRIDCSTRVEDPMARTTKKKDYPLSMRLPEADIATIDRAADLRGRSRTDFVREAAVRAAEDVLLERALIAMSPKGFNAFMAAIAAPAQEVPGLVAVLARTSPWDEGRKQG